MALADIVCVCLSKVERIFQIMIFFTFSSVIFRSSTLSNGGRACSHLIRKIYELIANSRAHISRNAARETFIRARAQQTYCGAPRSIA